MATCEPKKPYYDLELLKQSHLPIDTWIQEVGEKHRAALNALQVPSPLYPSLYSVTPALIDAFKKEGEEHVQRVSGDIEKVGYLYWIAKRNAKWYNAPRFDYSAFPLMQQVRQVLSRIRTLAETVEWTKHSLIAKDATCLYLLYFYALLVNPELNWVTMDYVANGNRYHQFGTQLKDDTETSWTLLKKISEENV